LLKKPNPLPESLAAFAEVFSAGVVAWPDIKKSELWSSLDSTVSFESSAEIVTTYAQDSNQMYITETHIADNKLGHTQYCYLCGEEFPKILVLKAWVAFVLGGFCLCKSCYEIVEGG
jgi:hypothetical protein